MAPIRTALVLFLPLAVLSSIPSSSALARTRAMSPADHPLLLSGQERTVQLRILGDVGPGGAELASVERLAGVAVEEPAALADPLALALEAGGLRESLPDLALRATQRLVGVGEAEPDRDRAPAEPALAEIGDDRLVPGELGVELEPGLVQLAGLAEAPQLGSS